MCPRVYSDHPAENALYQEVGPTPINPGDLNIFLRSPIINHLEIFPPAHLFFIFPLFAFNLPTPDKVVRREGFSTKILDRNGKTLYDIYDDQSHEQP